MISLIFSSNLDIEMNSLYAVEVIANPGGTFTPFIVSSPKFAPLPPTTGISFC